MKNVSKMLETKCSNNVLKILGDFWTLAIIQTLYDGEKRFCQLERDLIIASPTTLTNRLRKLEEQKLVIKKKETLDKLSVTYALTQKGLEVVPILKQINIFSQKYL